MIENLILITIDALRADHTSFIGNHSETTPNLERLSRKSITFTQAMSNSPYTPAAFMSIFASSYPLMFGGYEHLRNVRLTLSEFLKKNGYVTAGFHSNPFLSRFYGYDRGFDAFEDLVTAAQKQSSAGKKRVAGLLESHSTTYSVAARVRRIVPGFRRNFPYVDASTVNRKTIAWLKKAMDRNFFLWIHYMDVHFPYMPQAKHVGLFGSEPGRKQIEHLNELVTYDKKDEITEEELRGILNLYDAEIRYVDEQIGLLLAKLDDLDLLARTAIVVTADHGEEFMDHGNLGHGPKLYNELLHVPFLLYLPALDRSATVENKVALIDLAPTILDILGIEKPTSFLGQSLLPLINGQTTDRCVIAEIASERVSPDNPILRVDYAIQKIAYFRGDWKYIYSENGEDEFYNLGKDPKEKGNVIHKEPERAKEFKSKILEHILAEEKTRRQSDEIMKTRGKIEELKNLGNL